MAEQYLVGNSARVAELARDNETVEGMSEWKTEDGVHILRVHYTADPNKRSEGWQEEAKTGTTEQDWLQEMEIDFTVTKGLPWYPEFRFDLHVAKKPLAVMPGVPVIAGWDYGLTPATVFIQATGTGRIVVHAPEIQSWESGIIAHAHKVKAVIANYFPNNVVHHYGDPAGNQRVQTDEKTCVQVLREEFGILVRNGPVAFAQRDVPIRKALSQLIMGDPAFIVDPRNEWLIEALKGGYRRMEVQDIVTDKLDDNKYTHIVDALGYAVSMLQYAGDTTEYVMPKMGAM
jgi:hypothetical protein